VYPTGAAGSARAADAASVPGGDVAASAFPHPPQNFSPDSLEKPHAGQGRASGFPHLAQKRRPARLSAWQREHRMRRILCSDASPVRGGQRRRHPHIDLARLVG
jgi:hypothetical protein